MYEPSETADMLVDGDLAVVLLTWIDTITAADGTMIEQTREEDWTLPASG